MNTAVIYHSTYGHTKQYAQWIAQALSCDLLEEKSTTAADLRRYDTIIYGGPLFAGTIRGIKLITSNTEALQGKHLIVFTVGVTDPADQAAYASIEQQAFPENTQKPDMFYHFLGGIDAKKLKFSHRMIMSMVKKMMASGKGPEGVHMDGDTVNLMDQAAITPLVQYVQALG